VTKDEDSPGSWVQIGDFRPLPCFSALTRHCKFHGPALFVSDHFFPALLAATRGILVTLTRGSFVEGGPNENARKNQSVQGGFKAKRRETVFEKVQERKKLQLLTLQ